MTLIPTAEPFFFPGGPTSCLLIHGFTGTPKEMRGLGEYLAGRGHTVLGIRLAGHATHPKDLPRTCWQDWLQMLFDRLGTPDKQMFWVENSGHVIVREPERERIFSAIEDFITRVNDEQARRRR